MRSGDQGFDELALARDETRQGFSRSIDRREGRWVHHFTEARQDVGIDRCPSWRADHGRGQNRAPGADPRRWPAAFPCWEGKNKARLEAAGRLQDDESRRSNLCNLSARAERPSGSLLTCSMPSGKATSSISLADIDTDKNLRLHPDLLFLAVRAFCPCNRSRQIEEAEEHAERRACCPRVTRPLRTRHAGLDPDVLRQ